MRIGVIGTAGRSKLPEHKMTKSLYTRMYNDLLFRIQGFDNLVLVSGGAAWADSLAVSCFLAGKCSGLELHLPAGINPATNRFTEIQPNECGGVLNHYHAQFSKEVGADTIYSILKAKAKGATFIHYDGKGKSAFFARNKSIGAHLDMLIAYTWSEGDTPNDGGTGHCWSNSRCTNKVHVSLGKL